MTAVALKSTNTNTWRGIQDNLSSSSTTDSLSANQGRLLNSNKLDKFTAGGWSIEGAGQNNYCKLATITVTGAYINRPIDFEISGRGYPFSIVEIMFLSTSGTDPGLLWFKSSCNDYFYLKKAATSKWELYAKYNEPWGLITVHRVMGAGADVGVTLTLENVGTTAPTDLVAPVVGWGKIPVNPAETNNVNIWITT